MYTSFALSQPKVHFEVDGGEQNVDVPAQSSAAAQHQIPIYSATSLDPSATHTLQINVLDSGPFTLDYVLIGNGMLSPVESII